MKKFDLDYYRQHTDHYLEKNLEKIPSFNWLKKELAVKKGEKILDAGCGTGYLLNFVCPPLVEGMGVDISSFAIKKAKKLFPKLKFFQADITNLPFKDNFFDKVFSINVFEHLKNPQKALKEIKRILKPEGIFIIGTNNRLSLSWRLFKIIYGGDPTHIFEFSKKEFKDFVSQEFTILKVASLGSIGRFPDFFNLILNFFFRGDILIKAKKK
ncbi:MAG: class I SAM-dependent methyltransferase [Microgenomates group bacterium]